MPAMSLHWFLGLWSESPIQIPLASIRLSRDPKILHRRVCLSYAVPQVPFIQKIRTTGLQSLSTKGRTTKSTLGFNTEVLQKFYTNLTSQLFLKRMLTKVASPTSPLG